MAKKDKTWLKAYVGDVRDGCKKVADDSVDVVFCSPPYKKLDGLTYDLMLHMGRVFGRVLKPGGRAFVNFGQLNEDFDAPFTLRDLVLAGDGNLRAQQTVIWVKSHASGGWDNTCPQEACGHTWTEPVKQRGHYQPIKSAHVMNYCYEYVFQFSKQDPSLPLDKLSIGVPFTDKSNMKRGTRGQNGDLHDAGDVWVIPYATTGAHSKKTHKYQFPLELARRAIAVSGVPKGSVVFDPFMGGGTTAVVARLLGMNAISYDIDRSALKKAVKLWRMHEGERWRLTGAR